jgi:hypothetical protein
MKLCKLVINKYKNFHVDVDWNGDVVGMIKQCGVRGRWETEEIVKKDVIFDYFALFYMSVTPSCIAPCQPPPCAWS